MNSQASKSHRTFHIIIYIYIILLTNGEGGGGGGGGVPMKRMCIL